MALSRYSSPIPDMQPAQPPAYAQLAERLELTELDPSPAEAHGMLCGLICAGAPDARSVWIRELLGDAEEGDLVAAESLGMLDALARGTLAQMNGADFGFDPLLPGGDAGSRERALGLYDWCRGYLYGLGVAGVPQDRLTPQTREVLSDFEQITRMDWEAVGDQEQDQAAIAELEEYLRVAVMLVYEDRRPRAGDA